MGNAYCNGCCQQSSVLPNITHHNDTNQDDYPVQAYAKQVKQMVQVSSKVKDIYLKCRTPHIPQRRGVKLHYHYLFNYAAYYEGQWKNGFPHGYGRLVYDDGSLYQGCFNQGEAQCKAALFIKPDGSFYKGQVKHNKANGMGQMINQRLSDKVIYKGSWKDDLPHGEGRQIFGMGNCHYEGSFEKGKKNGKGIYYWNLKEYYSGDFKQNVMQGYGQHHSRDSVYRGEFKGGKKHGKGKLQNKLNKWTYQGDFYQGKMEGIGTYCWQDGTKFVGQFVNNQRTQTGKLILANGKVLQNPKFNKKQKMEKSLQINLNDMKAETYSYNE